MICSATFPLGGRVSAPRGVHEKKLALWESSPESEGVRTHSSFFGFFKYTVLEHCDRTLVENFTTCTASAGSDTPLPVTVICMRATSVGNSFSPGTTLAKHRMSSISKLPVTCEAPSRLSRPQPEEKAEGPRRSHRPQGRRAASRLRTFFGRKVSVMGTCACAGSVPLDGLIVTRPGKRCDSVKRKDIKSSPTFVRKRVRDAHEFTTTSPKETEGWLKRT